MTSWRGAWGKRKWPQSQRKTTTTKLQFSKHSQQTLNNKCLSKPPGNEPLRDERRRNSKEELKDQYEIHKCRTVPALLSSFIEHKTPYPSAERSPDSTEAQCCNSNPRYGDESNESARKYCARKILMKLLRGRHDGLALKNPRPKVLGSQLNPNSRSTGV